MEPPDLPTWAPAPRFEQVQEGPAPEELRGGPRAQGYDAREGRGLIRSHLDLSLRGLKKLGNELPGLEKLMTGQWESMTYWAGGAWAVTEANYKLWAQCCSSERGSES